MPLDIARGRAAFKAAVQGLLTDLAEETIARTTPVHHVDTGTMKATSRAVPPNSQGEAGYTVTTTDRRGRRVKREVAAIQPTGDLESAAVVPVVYAWDQERINPALGPAADEMSGVLPSIVARHQL